MFRVRKEESIDLKSRTLCYKVFQTTFIYFTGPLCAIAPDAVRSGRLEVMLSFCFSEVPARFTLVGGSWVYHGAAVRVVARRSSKLVGTDVGVATALLGLVNREAVVVMAQPDSRQEVNCE